MIPDRDTNFVYFSEKLMEEPEYNECFTRITAILNKYKIQYSVLRETKDIWARDYMPIQIDDNSFVQFKYEPSYLKDDLEFQSDPKIVCPANGIAPVYSQINLDGGNVIKWYDKAIITDRVFTENDDLELEPVELVNRIEKALNCEVIIIPALKAAYDMTGHADGYVRFLNSNTILVNELEKEFKYWQDGFLKAVKQHGLKYIEVPWFEYKDKEYPDSAIGLYLNYLQVGNLIVVPVFEMAGNRDQDVIDLFTKTFPDKFIEPVQINTVGQNGGLMNCITWNIKR